MKVPGLRWWVVALVALATVINYIDRQSINVLWPEIAKELYPDVRNAQEFGDLYPDVFQDVYPDEYQQVADIEAEELVRRQAAYDKDLEPLPRPRLDLSRLEAGYPDVHAAVVSEAEYSDGAEAATFRKKIFATITVVFMFAYAFGQAAFGKIFDWVGTRMGFVLSIGVWSIATAMHAFARGLLSFSIFRAILGFAEAGNWPGATKANAEWFPTKERALAQGIFNSGAAIGGIIAIPVIGYLAAFMSWQAIFVLVGAIGLFWLVPWLIIVKAPPASHAWLSDSERQYILTGQQNQDIDGDGNFDDGYAPGTVELLSHRQSWGIIIASAAIDPIWWIFVSWIPIYLHEVYNMSLGEIASMGWIPYVGAMFGAWFGGLLAQNRLKSGWTVNATRKLTITLGCLIMLPSLLALANPGSPLNAVLIMAVILFGFQTAIGNVQTLPSDFFGGKSVGTLAGFAGMAAKLAAAGLIYLVPWITQGGNYAPAFIIGAALAVIAIAAVWLLCGTIQPLRPHAAENESN